MIVRVSAVMLRSIVAAVGLLLAVAQPIPLASAQDRAPLLIEGTTTLYQRVLTRPGAIMHSTPGDAATAAPTEVPPLSLYFVYERRDANGEQWLEIGAGTAGAIDGWIPASTAIDWRQTLVLAFTNPVNRDRALFFRDGDYLLDLIESESLVAETDQIRTELESGTLPPDSEVISVEPETHVDLTENFYLLPILDWRDAYFETGFSSLVLKIAATSLQEDTSEPIDTPPRPGKPQLSQGVVPQSIRDYRAGVVFVMDTTKSMGPYIDRTREAVEQIYNQLEGSPYGDRISFGLIGFRDDPSYNPDIEYLSRIFANLSDGQTGKVFLSKVDEVTASEASTRSFNEDAFAGLATAVREIDWSGYAGRFIVLVTDAGARRGADPYSSTGLDAEQLRVLAQANGAAVLALHLLTPEGRQTHEGARDQYMALTEWPNVGSLYFPVEAGDVATFGTLVDQLGALLIDQIGQAVDGKLAEAAPAAGDATGSGGTEGGDGAQEGAQAALQRAALVGRAMQLAYLGRAEGTKAPRLFEAWVADRDLIDPSHKTLEVRVLITKNQLSDLQATLKAILEAGEATRITPTDFFGQLRSAAAAMSRRPEDIASESTRKLADTGLIGEYLEGLPYRSRVMELTEDDWLSWSFGQQREFLNDVEAKINLYQDIYDNADLWIDLDPTRTGGDSVYPILLDTLP